MIHLACHWIGRKNGRTMSENFTAGSLSRPPDYAKVSGSQTCYTSQSPSHQHLTTSLSDSHVQPESRTKTEEGT